jgi:hypothetical protein
MVSGKKHPQFVTVERQPRARTFADVGIDVPYGATGEVRTPCPRCSASRRKSRDRCLAIHMEKGLWFCHHCRWSGSLHDQHEHTWQPQYATSLSEPDARKQAAIDRLWHRAQPVRPGDPVDQYLRQRGIHLSTYPDALRYCSRMAYAEDGQITFHDGMLAQVVDIHGNLVSAHRTFLTRNGRKAEVSTPKKLMSPAIPGAVSGAAIRLYPAGSELAVAEGIETALAVHYATGLAIWSCISAHGLETVELPPEVSLVRIYTDNDPVGVEAAYALGYRLLREGRRVKLFIPPQPGTDWLDVLQQEGGEA